MREVVVYTKGYCPYCYAAKNLLNSKAVEFTEIAIDGDEALRNEMIERAGRTTVPQIFIGDHHVGGYDDLAALNSKGELEPLLQE
ncbi:MAG: glutaredoxin 3 [Wenzhouxiangellaceae bacterium]